MTPPDAFQSGEHTTRLRQRPGAHAAMSNVAFAESGGNSPRAIRSRTISRADRLSSLNRVLLRVTVQDDVQFWYFGNPTAIDFTVELSPASSGCAFPQRDL
jgi:hypothetical protein